ncbi:hypothetical protein V6N13_057065 [Hibiscus sabdariffa]
MQTATNISQSSMRSRAVPVIPTCRQGDLGRVSSDCQNQVLNSNIDRASEATWEDPNPDANIVDPESVVVTKHVRDEGYKAQSASQNDNSIPFNSSTQPDDIRDELADPVQEPAVMQPLLPQESLNTHTMLEFLNLSYIM